MLSNFINKTVPCFPQAIFSAGQTPGEDPSLKHGQEASCYSGAALAIKNGLDSFFGRSGPNGGFSGAQGQLAQAELDKATLDTTAKF
jgi:hypothetical protein